MANNVYEGGIPSSAGKNLFPSNDMEGENGTFPKDNVSPFDSPSQSGPATFSGAYTNQFMDEASYQGDMSVDSEPKMKIVHPNDIKNDC